MTVAATLPALSYRFDHSRPRHGYAAASHSASTFCTGRIMLKWALIFAVIAIVAGLMGFTGVAAGAAGIAKFLAIAALVVFLVLIALVTFGVGALKK